MPGATLTLGLTTFNLNPPSGSGVTVSNPSPANFNVSTSSTAVSPLVVNTSTSPSQSSGSHTVTFTSALGSVSVDTTLAGPDVIDVGDRIVFQGNVASAQVKAGNPNLTSFTTPGDTVIFSGTLGANSSILTGSSNDSVVFANNAVNAYQGTAGQALVNAGSGSDSIRFSSSTKVGPNILIDFGTQGNSDLDILFGSARSTFQSAGVQIRNFTQGFDQVRIGSSTLRTQSEINTFFGDSGGSIRLV
ncbi:MAG: hypothetical protein VKJ05_03125 [Synechococcaceae cyanobacterium]|nr:hypothetical protein [Synechococcaceae cyanobacterium]